MSPLPNKFTKAVSDSVSPTPTTDPAKLAMIRDLMAQQQGAAPVPAGATAPVQRPLSAAVQGAAAPATAAATAPASPLATSVAPASAPIDGTTTVPAQRGFQLPELIEPDPNDPKYKGEGGKDQYAVDKAEHDHRVMIHQNAIDLDALFQKMHPGRDFQGEYEAEVKAMKEHEANREKPEGWKRGLLALGDMNPAVKQSGRSGLADYDQQLAERNARADNSFSAQMVLKQKMHEAKAAEAEAKGNWRVALSEKEKAAMAEASNQHIANAQSEQRTHEVIAGQNQRARMRGDTMVQSAQIRANTIANAHGLTGSRRDKFLDYVGKELARRGIEGKDLTKTYDPLDLDALAEDYSRVATELEHGPTDTAPAKHTPKAGTPQVKPSGAKEKF
jgi:hypothetical protein